MLKNSVDQKQDDHAYIIFRCKSENCKTIFTYENIIEMNELIGNITNDAIWQKICIQNDDNVKKNDIGIQSQDKYGCTGESYNNLT